MESTYSKAKVCKDHKCDLSLEPGNKDSLVSIFLVLIKQVQVWNINISSIIKKFLDMYFEIKWDFTPHLKNMLRSHVCYIRLHHITMFGL